MESLETGRIWTEIIYPDFLPELKSDCKLFKVRIISIFPESVPNDPFLGT